MGWAAYRESGTTQEFTGAERDGEYVLRMTTNPGAYSDTWWYGEVLKIFARGTIELYARGYLKDAMFGLFWDCHGVFCASLVYVGDDALLVNYSHVRSDPVDNVSAYDGKAVSEGWHNCRMQLNFDANTIKNKLWSGDFDTEPEAWDQEIGPSDFNGGELSVHEFASFGPGMGATASSGEICDLAYWGYEVTP